MRRVVPERETKKRARSQFQMAGLNENRLNMLNGAHMRESGNKRGRPNIDTPMNAVSTTAVMLPPPVSRDPTFPDAKCYAPKSKNEMADRPSRGDWAVTTHRHPTWGKVENNPNFIFASAVSTFSNMGGVPEGTPISYVGVVGNASQSKNGKSTDRHGQVYSAGAITGRNTGPEYIPPCSFVYLSAYPFTIEDPITGEKKPGYLDPAWEEAGIDKWQPALHALNDTDVGCAVHSMESDIRELVQKESNMVDYANQLNILHIHPHVPLYKYAVCYFFTARVSFLMNKIELDKRLDPALQKSIIKAYNEAAKRNKLYWQEVDKEQKDFQRAIGGSQYDTRRVEALANNGIHLKDGASDDEVKNTLLFMYPKLLEASSEVWKQQYNRQNAFIRNQVFGKTRYASPPTHQVDVLTGYKLG